MQETRLQVVVARTDTRNKNNRIYPSAVMVPTVSAFRERIRTGGPVVGRLSDEPERLHLAPPISHLIHDLYMAGTDGGDVVAHVEWCHPSLPVAGMEFRICGEGSVAEDGRVENYHLLTITACRKGTGA